MQGEQLMWPRSPNAKPPSQSPNFNRFIGVGDYPITIACGVCMVFICAFSAARLYAKLRIIGKTAVDDCMFWISLPLLLTGLSLLIVSEDNEPKKVGMITKNYLVAVYLNMAFLPTAAAMIKVTLLCLIISAFKPLDKLRYLCYAGIFVTLAYYLSTVVINVVGCHPRGGNDQTAYILGFASPGCSNRSVRRLGTTTAAFTVAIDLYILALPLPAVARLDISRKKKIGVSLILSAGGLACVASIVRLVYRICEMSNESMAMGTVVSLVVELSIGMIIPTIGPVWKLVHSILSRHYPSLLGSSKGESGPHAHAQPPEKKRRHQRGGLSEIDSMRTFGTTVDQPGEGNKRNGSIDFETSVLVQMPPVAHAARAA